MEEKYLVSVIGTQYVDENEETIELTTSASYYELHGNKYIRYREYDDEDDDIVITNIIKIESDEKVTVTKNVDGRISTLILECGVRHQTMLSSMFGSLTIGVFTDNIEADIDESGGTVEADYSIDFNADVESENHIKIVFKKKGEKENVEDSN